MNVAELRVSAHAVQRYIERVRPGLNFKPASDEIAHLLPSYGRIVTDAPPWAGAHADHHTGCWVLIGDDVAFPVIGVSITTCVTRTTHPRLRKTRRKAKSRRREIERYRGDTYGGSKSRARRRARAVAPRIDEEDRRVH